MKQYLYITLLLLSCWGVSAQNRVEATLFEEYRIANPINALKSSNGKYLFDVVKTVNGKYDQYNWIIKNTITNEIIYKTKDVFFLTTSNYFEVIKLYFNVEVSFKLNECGSSIIHEKCKEQYPVKVYFHEFNNLNEFVGKSYLNYLGIETKPNSTPYISAVGTYVVNGGSFGTEMIPMPITMVLGDLFGIEGGQNSNPTYNTNPELASSMVYQDRGDGVYTVSEYYHAKALILTDEGDLQIVNTKEQVIWSLKQSQQEDKNFIAKGNTTPIQTASLIHTPEGHIELSNSKYQQEFDLTLLAKDYVLLSASNNKASELSVTSPNSMISMQVYQDSPSVSTAKSGLTSKSSTAKINPTIAPKLLSIPDQKNGITNVIKKTTKTAKTAKIVKIEKPMSTNTLTVFPNPVKDIINIVFDDATETLTKLQILSLDGRVVKEFTGSQTPNIQELSSGMYLYLIESTKNKYNGKIIKQ